MKKIKTTTHEASLEVRIDRTLKKMKHRDLQKACVLKGLEFQFVISYDHHKLANWFYKHFEDPEDLSRIPEFDVFMEKELTTLGYKRGDPMLAPCFRLGYVPPEFAGDAKEYKPRKNPSIEPNKPKREIDQTTGIVAGTKKSLTYSLTIQGMDLAVIVLKVKEKFPDAQEKSIKIWSKRCRDAKKQQP